jgi:hypothetical protein
VNPQPRLFTALPAEVSGLDETQRAILSALHQAQQRVAFAPRNADGELLPSGRTLTWLWTLAQLERVAKREGISG